MNRSSRIIWVLLSVAIALCAVAGRVYFLLISARHLPVTGDEALAKLKAMAIAAGERPLLFWGTPYQFPFESYLLSVFIDFLPSTAFGARVILALLALLGVGGFVWLARRVFPAGSRWPVILLILLPSTYVMTLQSAYFIPQHTITMVFCMLLSVGVVNASRNPGQSLGWIAMTGGCAGLALSTHFLSLPVVAATFLVVIVTSDIRLGVRRALFFLPPFILGLLPYLLTYEAASEMAATVTGRHSPDRAFLRFFSPVLWNNLTAVLGFDVVLLPEPMRRHWSGYTPFLLKPLLLGFWVLLGWATFLSSRRLFRSFKSEGRLTLSVHELFVATMWAALLAFCFSVRGEAQQYRYLLPAAWTFPFLFGVVYTACNSRARIFLGSVAVLLVVLNVAHTSKVMSLWQNRGYVANTAHLFDLSSVEDYLEDQQLKTCYATFWIAYRITYRTERRIICDQPFNGRFLGWPLPFKESFDLEDRAAFVLSDIGASRLRATDFLKMLEWHRVEATVARHGNFFVFHDFRYKSVSNSRLIDTTGLSFTFNGEQSEALAQLTDGDRLSTWQSDGPPVFDSTLEIRLDEPRVLHRVRILYEQGAIAEQPLYRLEAADADGNWSILRKGIKPTADRLEIDERHTRFFFDDRQDISFEPVQATAVRLVVEDQNGQSPWSISEIQLSEDAT